MGEEDGRGGGEEVRGGGGGWEGWGGGWEGWDEDGRGGMRMGGEQQGNRDCLSHSPEQSIWLV